MDEENHAGGTGTTYVILRETTDSDGHLAWQEIAEADAHHAAGAAKRAAAQYVDPKDLEQGVQLRAVTARAWQAGLVRVRTEHKTRIVTS